MHCFKAVFCYLCCWQCHHPHSTMCICPTGSSQWTRWQQSESPIVTPLPPINHIKADSSYQSTHKPDHGLTRDQRHQICSLDCVKELKHDDNLFHSSWRICKAWNLIFGLQRLRDLEFIIKALGIWVFKWYDICVHVKVPLLSRLVGTWLADSRATRQKGVCDQTLPPPSSCHTRIGFKFIHVLYFIDW